MKVGMDDFLTTHTADELLALARPWDDGEAARRRDNAGDDLSLAATLKRLIFHSEYTLADIRLAAQVAIKVHEKRAKGEVEPDGRVVISAAEIANDWRSVPTKGQRVATTNQDGSKPHLTRKRVKPLMQTAIERGLVNAEARTVPRTTDDGTRYEDTEWLIAPADTLKAQLNPWVRYEPAAPKTRKPRTITPPCPTCGEVHPITQVDYCQGCKQVVAWRTIEPKTAEECAWDNLSRTDATPATPPQAPPQDVPQTLPQTLPASTSDRRDNLSRTIEHHPQPLHPRNVGQSIPGDFHNAPGIDGYDPKERHQRGFCSRCWCALDVCACGPLQIVPPPELPAPELVALAPIQERLAAASHSEEEQWKPALADVGADLSDLARQRGRSPVPKPKPKPSATPANVAGDDYWTNA